MNQEKTMEEPVLVLCRSAFQAVLAERILQQEGVSNFDLIYNNGHVNPKDRHYFARLASKARSSVLFSKKDPAGWLKMLPIIASSHGSILVSNLTFSVFRTLIRSKDVPFFTFDDGAGNFISTSPTRVGERNKLERLRDRVLDLQAIPETYRMASAHYTIAPELENVTASENLKRISFSVKSTAAFNGTTINLIAGQPFNEYLADSEMDLMKHALAEIKQGKYIPHPREAVPISPDFEVISDERLFEDIAFSLADEGHRLRVIGGLTTVLMTARHPAIERFYLAASRSDEAMHMMSDAGCQTFELYTSAGRDDWHDTTRRWQ